MSAVGHVMNSPLAVTMFVLLPTLVIFLMIYLGAPLYHRNRRMRARNRAIAARRRAQSTRRTQP